MTGSLVNAALEGVLGFHLAKFGGDQTQHHDLALGQESQGAEVAAAIVVILQEVGVEVHVREQGFGDRFVVTGGSMCALEVASAQVHGQGHASGLVGDHLVDEIGIAVGQFIGVIAALSCSFTHFFIAQVGQVGVVHLHIGASRSRE